MENNSDTKFECVSLLKSPKVLSLFFFFILLFLINYHWQYAGSRAGDFSSGGFYRVNFKIDRFTGLKFVDVYDIKDLTWNAYTVPSYNHKFQLFAIIVLRVENFLLYGSLLIAVLWVVLSWTSTIFRSFKDSLRIKR
jgi:hypothetical protein